MENDTTLHTYRRQIDVCDGNSLKKRRNNKPNTHNIGYLWGLEDGWDLQESIDTASVIFHLLNWLEGSWLFLYFFNTHSRLCLRKGEGEGKGRGKEGERERETLM